MTDKISILVIDDCPIIPKMVKKSLAGSVYEVIGYAENGLTGVEMYGNIRPDIVIIDITMPELDGVETVRQIYKIDREAFIIILSATDYSDVREELEEMGVKYFVNKPFEPDDLLNVLSELTGI